MSQQPQNQPTPVLSLPNFNDVDDDAFTPPRPPWWRRRGGIIGISVFLLLLLLGGIAFAILGNRKPQTTYQYQKVTQ